MTYQNIANPHRWLNHFPNLSRTSQVGKIISELSRRWKKNANPIRDLILLQIFLCVRLLERKFKNITYIHVSRIFNQVDDSYANYVLDWHLSHRL